MNEIVTKMNALTDTLVEMLADQEATLKELLIILKGYNEFLEKSLKELDDDLQRTKPNRRTSK